MTSPTESAHIAEYDHKGLRRDVHRIVMFDFRGERKGNSNWWQVQDIAMRLLTGERRQRDYRRSK